MTCLSLIEKLNLNFKLRLTLSEPPANTRTTTWLNATVVRRTRTDRLIRRDIEKTKILIVMRRLGTHEEHDQARQCSAIKRFVPLNFSRRWSQSAKLSVFPFAHIVLTELKLSLTFESFVTLREARERLIWKLFRHSYTWPRQQEERNIKTF